MTLRKKIEEYLLNSESTRLFFTKGEVEETSKGLAQICIQEQITLLEELKKYSEDTNAKFRLMLSDRIEKLKVQLK